MDNRCSRWLRGNAKDIHSNPTSNPKAQMPYSRLYEVLVSKPLHSLTPSLYWNAIAFSFRKSRSKSPPSCTGSYCHPRQCEEQMELSSGDLGPVPPFWWDSDLPLPHEHTSYQALFPQPCGFASWGISKLVKQWNWFSHSPVPQQGAGIGVKPSSS